MKNNSLKNRLLRVTAAILCVCMVFSFFSFFAYFAPRALSARAEEETEYTEFNNDVTLSNGQFTGSTTTSPTMPSGWTGAYIGGTSGNVVSGIISLDANYTKNHETLKLGSYPEFQKDTDIPNTPFGSATANPITGSYYPGTNKNVLMINTNQSKTAYGYSTSDISLMANSYYKFSAWVKTGIFGDEQGAAISVTGLDKPVGIWNIDTVYDLPRDSRTNLPVLDIYNNFGFVEHTIYIATGPNTETVKLSLSVGDYADTDHYFLSKGYAFFDNVKAYQLSPTNYHFETVSIKGANKNNVLIYDMNPSDLLMVTNKDGVLVEAGSFSNAKDGWTKIQGKDDEWTDPLTWGIYNGAGLFIEEWDEFGLTSNPFTPNGQYDILKNTERTNNDIMVLSSHEYDEKYRSVSAGIKSGDITVEKEKYYRLSAWYNTQSGASATIAVSGQDTSYLGKLGPIKNSTLTTNNNTARYGWQRSTFYIKGSAFIDVKINLELWLGGEGEKSSGVVMFDDITFDEITFEQYNDNKFGGTQISIDNNSSSGTGVTNGDFAEMDFTEENIYPLAPTGWKFIDTATAGTMGHSTATAKTEDAIYGVAPAQEEHYAARQEENYAGIDNPLPEGLIWGNVNVLLMHSPVDTAFGYRSGEISIAAGTDYKLSVNLRTNLNGYGASLILKNGNSIVSNIEGIHSVSDWNEYSFYISGAGGSATLTLEIWFGMTGKIGKDHKLSSGHMFVNTVKLETITSESGSSEIAARMDEYNQAASPSLLNFAVYKLGAYDFNAYDRYENEPVRQLYDMSLSQGSGTLTRAGVITNSMPAGQNIVPSYFHQAHTAVPADKRFENSLYLENINRGWSKYEADNSLGLTASAFYKVDFSIMVELEPDTDDNKNAVGAGIWLDDKGISDIRNTYHSPVLQGPGGTQIYELEFQTFSFYYATGTENTSVKWALTLGGSEFNNQEIAGRVYLNYILLTEIDQTTFDAETAKVTEAEESDDIDDITNVLIIDNRTPETEEETPPAEEGTEEPADSGCNSLDWYVIPSILFAVAILIAIFGVVFKRFMARRPKNKNRSKTVSYDRNEAPIPAAKKAPGETEAIKASDSAYEDFDETERTEKINIKPEKTELVSTVEIPVSKQPVDSSETPSEEVAKPDNAKKSEETEKQTAFSNEFDD